MGRWFTRKAPVWKPWPATAREKGRTERLHLNGMVSPDVRRRLELEGEHMSWAERIDSCIRRLIEWEVR